MNNSPNKSKKIIIILFAIAGILGLSAIGVTYYLSQLEDVTPTDSNADSLNYSELCQQVYIKAFPADNGTEGPVTDGEVLYPDPKQARELEPGETIRMGVVLKEFSQTLYTSEYTDFYFELNGKKFSAKEVEAGSLTQAQLEEIAKFNTKVDPTAVVLAESNDTSEIAQDKSTISVIAKVEVTNTTTQEVKQISCGGIYAVNIATDPGPNPDPDPDPGACIAQGQQGTHANAAQDQQCCAGLTEAGVFANPNANACNPTQDLFVCIIPNDDQCSTGENVCNSANDCGSTPSDPGDPGDEESSNFAITVSSGTTCVERISPNNSMTFTITVTNNDTETEEVVSIKNKLPLGFSYTAGSTKINSVAVSDTGLVTTTETGESVDVNWDPATNWSLTAGQSMTITFNATATGSALTGSQQNEAILTPLNTPEDADAMHVEYVFTVEQNCETPGTGLFDSTLARIVTGLLIIIAAVGFYLSNSSQRVSEELATSAVAKAGNDFKQAARAGLRSFGLKLTNPRAHFEEKTLKKDRKAK
ncbi:MAG: hypothetical protein Fur003_3590 [Candidatus Dojkabacteria bacterium]